MKKNKITITIIIIVVISMIIFLAYLNISQNKKDNRPFRKQDFPKTIIVENNTEYDKLDTIIYVLANKVFNLDTLEINVYPIKHKIDNENYEFYAYTNKIYFKSHSYIIYVNPNLSFSDLKLTVSHEFIHIKQYERDDLEIIDNVAKFKGRKYDLRDIEYMDRPFEIEAFNKQNKILFKLDSFLYK